jgi:S1-C subfamily serine protease
MSRLSKLLLAGTGVAAVVVVILVLISVVGGGGGASAVSEPSGTAAAATPDTSGFSPAAIYQKSANGVVLVLSTFGSTSNNPLGTGGEALGTGFIVNKNGTILTNAHVVSENGQKASQVEVAFRQGQDQTSAHVKAQLVGVDQTSDVAVLKVDPGSRTLTPLPLGDSSKVQIGQWVVAIGNPLGFSFSLTQGIVSGIARNLQAPNNATIPNGIQTDAAINQGNSGGPLLDADGNVIGINEQIATTSGSFSGLGFAIPINEAKSVMDQILATGTAQHAFLGIEGQTIDETIAQLLKLPVKQGVLVASVVLNSGAAKAGIRGATQTQTVQGIPFKVGGDIITKLDGQPLTGGMDQLAGAIAEKEPGDQVTLTALRDGKTQDVTVTLGQRPQS